MVSHYFVFDKPEIVFHRVKYLTSVALLLLMAYRVAPAITSMSPLTEFVALVYKKSSEIIIV
jgi:hypothetical protein